MLDNSAARCVSVSGFQEEDSRNTQLLTRPLFPIPTLSCFTASRHQFKDLHAAPRGHSGGDELEKKSFHALNVRSVKGHTVSC